MVDDSRGRFREYFRRASSEGARQKMTHFDIQTVNWCSGSSTGVYIAPPAQEPHITPQQN
jgi:hypothetical protein